MADNSSNVSGTVDRVSIKATEKGNTDRTIKVHIGQDSFALDNIREVLG